MLTAPASVACMFRFLCKIYDPALLDFYIPHRYREGYGVSKMGIDAKENNFSLIVSLDCGIKSVELIAYAKTTGIDFIVCDHHLPDADYRLRQPFSTPNKKIALTRTKNSVAAALAFKLITAPPSTSTRKKSTTKNISTW